MNYDSGVYGALEFFDCIKPVLEAKGYAIVEFPIFRNKNVPPIVCVKLKAPSEELRDALVYVPIRKGMSPEDFVSYVFSITPFHLKRETESVFG